MSYVRARCILVGSKITRIIAANDGNLQATIHQIAAMSESIRRTKSSLKGSKTCHDALLLGLSQPKDLCRNCKNYFDLPVKKKPQSEMGVVFSRCERPQMNGISPASSSTEETGKRKAVYCQLASTPAPTKRVLLLSSTSEAKPPGGRPSI